MAQISGITKQQAYQKAYYAYLGEIHDICVGQKERYDALVAEYNKKKKTNEAWAWATLPFFPSFMIARGLYNGLIDAVAGFNESSARFINNVGHLFDESDGVSWQNDLAYLLNDGWIGMVESIGTSFLGFEKGAQKALKDIAEIFGINPMMSDQAFGKDDKYDKKIEGLSNWADTQRAGMLRDENHGFFDVDTGSEAQENKDYLENRWTDGVNNGNLANYATEDNVGNFGRYLVDASSSMVENGLQDAKWMKDIVSVMTDPKLGVNGDTYQVAWGDNKFYQFASGTFQSVGRMLPMIMMSYIGAQSGVSPSTLKLWGSAYFGASVFGQTFEEAQNNGASMEDSYVYATAHAFTELATEELEIFGAGIKPGEIPLARSWNEFFADTAQEAFEEVVAEVTSDGISYYSNPENMINDTETSQEYLSRLFWAGMGGAVLGATMTGGQLAYNNSTVEGKAGNLYGHLNEGVGLFTNEYVTTQYNKDSNKILKQLNKMDSEQADAILKDNPALSALITKKTDVNGETSYVLTDVGSRASKGDFASYQGSQKITKATHAVGNENSMYSYNDTVDIDGKDIKIHVLTNEEVSKLPENKQQQVQWFKDRNIRVAFVRADNQKVAWNGYTDTSNWTVYINVDSKDNKGGFTNAFAHELHDTIRDMGKKGLLTERQRKAYEEFMGYVASLTNKQVQALDVKFDEERYRQQYKDRKDIENLILTEKISAVIEQVFYNEFLLKRAFAEKKNVFQKIADIFNKKVSAEALKEELGFSEDVIKKLPGAYALLKNIELAFKKVASESVQSITSTDIIKNVGGIKTGTYSLDGKQATYFSSTQEIVDYIKALSIQENGIKGSSFYGKKFDFFDKESKEYKEYGHVFSIDGKWFFSEKKFKVPEYGKVNDLTFDSYTNTFNFFIDASYNDTPRFLHRIASADTFIGGEFIEDATWMTAGLNSFALDNLMKTDVSGMQSYHIGTFAEEKLSVNTFAQDMNDKSKNVNQDDGAFRAVIVLKQQVLENRGTSVYKNDSYTPMRELPSESNKDQLKEDEIAFQKVTDDELLEQPYDRHAPLSMTHKILKVTDIRGMFWHNFNFIIRQINDQIEHYNQEEDLEQIVEELLSDTSMAFIGGLKQTLYGEIKDAKAIKEEMLKAQDVDGVEVSTVRFFADEGLKYLLGNYSLGEIGLGLIDAKQLESGIKVTRKSDIIRDAQAIDALSAVNDYVELLPYNIDKIAEAKGNVYARDIYAFLLYNIKNIDEAYYQRIKDFADKNGIVIIESENDNAKPQYEAHVEKTKNSGKTLFSFGSVDSDSIIEELKRTVYNENDGIDITDGYEFSDYLDVCRYFFRAIHSSTVMQKLSYTPLSPNFSDGGLFLMEGKYAFSIYDFAPSNIEEKLGLSYLSKANVTGLKYNKDGHYFVAHIVYKNNAGTLKEKNVFIPRSWQETRVGDDTSKLSVYNFADIVPNEFYTTDAVVRFIKNKLSFSEEFYRANGLASKFKFISKDNELYKKYGYFMSVDNTWFYSDKKFKPSKNGKIAMIQFSANQNSFKYYHLSQEAETSVIAESLNEEGEYNGRYMMIKTVIPDMKIGNSFKENAVGLSFGTSSYALDHFMKTGVFPSQSYRLGGYAEPEIKDEFCEEIFQSNPENNQDSSYRIIVWLNPSTMKNPYTVVYNNDSWTSIRTFNKDGSISLDSKGKNTKTFNMPFADNARERAMYNFFYMFKATKEKMVEALRYNDTQSAFAKKTFSVIDKENFFNASRYPLNSGISPAQLKNDIAQTFDVENTDIEESFKTATYCFELLLGKKFTFEDIVFGVSKLQQSSFGHTDSVLIDDFMKKTEQTKAVNELFSNESYVNQLKAIDSFLKLFSYNLADTVELKGDVFPENINAVSVIYRGNNPREMEKNGYVRFFRSKGVSVFVSNYEDAKKILIEETKNTNNKSERVFSLGGDTSDTLNDLQSKVTTDDNKQVAEQANTIGRNEEMIRNTGINAKAIEKRRADLPVSPLTEKENADVIEKTKVNLANAENKELIQFVDTSIVEKFYKVDRLVDSFGKEKVLTDEELKKLTEEIKTNGFKSPLIISYNDNAGLLLGKGGETVGMGQIIKGDVYLATAKVLGVSEVPVLIKYVDKTKKLVNAEGTALYHSAFVKSNYKWAKESNGKVANPYDSFKNVFGDKTPDFQMINVIHKSNNEYEVQDHANTEEEQEIRSSYTSSTQTHFAQGAGSQSPSSTQRIVDAHATSKTVTWLNYDEREDIFAGQQPAILSRLNKSKNSMDKNILAIYKALVAYVTKLKVGNRLVNHLSYGVAKALVYEMSEINRRILEDTNRTDKTFNAQEIEDLVKKVNEAIFSILGYVDEHLRVEVNVSASNPNGYLFTRAMYWYLRDVRDEENWDSSTQQKFNNDKRGIAYRRLINAIININSAKGMNELNLALKHFSKVTDVDIVVDLALKKAEGNQPHTIGTVKAQWKQDLENTKEIENISGYSGKLQGLFGLMADPFTVAEIVGGFHRRSWAQILMEKLVRAVDRQLTVNRVFDAIFEQDDWLKKNYKKLVGMDKKTSERIIAQLGGARLTMSQVIFLRNMMVRELVRNRFIDEGIIKGNKTHHFDDGNEVDILSITDIKENKYDGKTSAKISNNIALLNELDGLIEADSFAKEYNAKVYEMFDALFPYVNERYKEIHGVNLRNDGAEIKKAFNELSESEQQELLDGLPSSINVNTIGNIYSPFLLHSNAYFKPNVDFKEILDLGVFDGMTQELTDSDGRISVETITNVIFTYKREIANFYGMHRVMRDWSITINEQMDGYKQTTYVKQYIDDKVVKFFERLMKDMAGYKSEKTHPEIQKAIAFIKRSFYRYSLAMNVKVIATQFASLLNLAVIYGDNATFLSRMVKNLFAQLTPANKALAKELLKQNNIYWDRSDVATYDIGEATNEGIAGNNDFNRLMDVLMKGITLTDNMINKAFYLALLETVNPETGKLYTKEEASETLKTAILRSQSSALSVSKSSLLRTDNDFLKMTLKFMGEPMKMVTQLYSSAKNLQLVKKVEASQDKIIEVQDAKVDAENAKLREAQNYLAQKTLEEEESVTKSEREKKEATKARRDAQDRVDKQTEVRDNVEQNAKEVKQRISSIIRSKSNVRQLAVRRSTAFLSTLLYISSLSVGFSLVRSKGGDDKPEEETLAEYLAKKMGWAFTDEVMGMLPWVRDLYQTIAHGFDLDVVDEIGSINEFSKNLYYLFNALSNGNEVQWGKAIRSMLLSSSKFFGIPLGNIERIFKTSILYISEDTSYKYNNLIGGKNTDNIRLAQAIKDGDTSTISLIIEHKINQRNIRVSNGVFSELKRLASVGYEVSMSGVNDSYTVDGVEYVLTKKQKEKFAEIYNGADFVIQRIIHSSEYRKLNDDMKQSLIQAIYNYYYRKAKQDVLGVEIIPEAIYFKTYSKAVDYFLKRAESFYRTQKSDKYKEEQRKKAVK